MLRWCGVKKSFFLVCNVWILTMQGFMRDQQRMFEKKHEYKKLELAQKILISRLGPNPLAIVRAELAKSDVKQAWKKLISPLL